MQEAARASWKVLVVDDEPDVLVTTGHTLMDVEVLGRPLTLLTASSAAQAEIVLQAHPDIAVILLDVVMEKMQSGLTLITRIRTDLGNHAVRIILRTGNPGEAPEQEVVLNYGIDDYIHKGSVTRNRIITSVVTAIKAFDQLQRVQRLGTSMKALFDLSNEMTRAHSMPELATLLALRLDSVLPGLANGAVAYAWRDPKEKTPLLTFLKATLRQDVPRANPSTAGVPQTAMLGAYISKTSTSDGNEAFLYKANGKIGCLIWACKDTPIDDIEHSVLQNLASLIGVNLDRLKNIKQRYDDSTSVLDTFFKEFAASLGQVRNTQSIISQRIAGARLRDEQLDSLVNLNESLVANLALKLESKVANLRFLRETTDEIRLEVDDLGDIVTQAIDRSHDLWAPTGPLQVNIHANCLAKLNEAMLVNGFMSLLDNAVKAVLARSRRAGGRQIAVTVAKEDDNVVLSIQDQGVGIDPDHLPFVFMPYFSGDERVHGVGLSLVQRSIQQMGGTLRVTSKVGEGSTFTIAIPAAPL